ncbi:hypothetical protein MLD38_006449 [Melastoma candidum]|uniref:Uncharacterized protein n=1 Tax=Melastoma candidum TaxID=119954 RepID=A0ACB9RMY0_9MYRT|nr:hypothetical protein MLD38_006449 [Melastoma candidum]
MGVRAAPMSVRNAVSSAMAPRGRFLMTTLLVVIVLLQGVPFALQAASTDSDALLKFKQSIVDPKNALSSWGGSTTPCAVGSDKANWAGVKCAGETVWGLQLESMGLSGRINVDSLMGLSALRSFSVMNNQFDGPMPNIAKLGMLKSVYLSNNKFSGQIADNAFANMLSLKKLHLAGNGFTGGIPSSLTNLPKLIDLRLEGNQFTGTIPEFKQKDLQEFNVSSNDLDGLIPSSLVKMNSSSFSGNKALCGLPLNPCADAPPEPPGEKSSHLNIIIPVVVVFVVALIAGLITCILRHKRKSTSVEDPPVQSNLQKKSSFQEATDGRPGARSPENSSHGRRAENMKLSFVRDNREKFDLQDLLKASAEILGSGCFGSSYKAALLGGPAMVVKRFRQMNNVGREDFQEHMRRLGRLSHPNLLPLVAYYYRKEEKLLVYDYVESGSLAVYLHSNHTRDEPSLDWPTRLKIVKGITRGLSYLYNELPSLIAPHGHLKSSNVLLGDSFKPLLNDYALIPVLNLENARDLLLAYKSPEYLQQDRITKKTDVWSLGIIILEILTGKLPVSTPQHMQSNAEDGLAIWVRSTMEAGDSVLDKEMKTTASNENEINKLLRVALACCEPDVEKRPDIKEAMEQIEEVREKDGDDEFYSMRSTRAIVDEIGIQEKNDVTM